MFVADVACQRVVGGGGLPLESPAVVEVQDPAPQSDDERPSAASGVVGV